MPTYVYAVIKPDGSNGEIFEVFQKMTDPLLTQHPETRQPVRRVFLPTALNTKGSGKKYSNPDLQKKHGFTRYEKAGDGTYVKAFGQGPEGISR